MVLVSKGRGQLGRGNRMGEQFGKERSLDQFMLKAVEDIHLQMTGLVQAERG